MRIAHAAVGVLMLASTVRAEVIDLALTHQFGVSSVESYSGLVDVIVTGQGGSSGGETLDPFYRFEQPIGAPLAEPVPHRGIRLSRGDCACAPGEGAGREECASPDWADSIVQIDGVDLGTFPPYRPDHAYRFVLDLAAESGPVTLGLFDCGVSDNYGAFSVTLTQLTELPPTSTITPTATVTPTGTPTVPAPPTINPTLVACPGNCDSSDTVTVDELVTAVRANLGEGACGIGPVDIRAGVEAALYGCGAPTPPIRGTNTPVITRTPTQTPTATDGSTPTQTLTATTIFTPTATPIPCGHRFDEDLRTTDALCSYSGDWALCSGEHLRAHWMSDGHLVVAVVDMNIPPSGRDVYVGAVVNPNNPTLANIYTAALRFDFVGAVEVDGLLALHVGTNHGTSVSDLFVSLPAVTVGDPVFGLCDLTVFESTSSGPSSEYAGRLRDALNALSR